MTKSSIDKLSKMLFDGEIKAADLKIMPGDDEAASSEEVAQELYDSMHRVGLAKDGKLVNKRA